LRERIAVLLFVEGTRDGSIMIEVRSPDSTDRLTAKQTTVAFSAWSENDDVIRASLKHDESGHVAYLQGGAPLLDLARALGLSVKRSRA
jgi:hypothetical protein